VGRHGMHLSWQTWLSDWVNVVQGKLATKTFYNCQKLCLGHPGVTQWLHYSTTNPVIQYCMNVIELV